MAGKATAKTGQAAAEETDAAAAWSAGASGLATGGEAAGVQLEPGETSACEMIPSQSLRRSRGERRAAGWTNATAAWWAGAAVEQGATARLHPEPGGSICIGCTSATSASASSGCWAAVGVENGRTVWGAFESAGPDAPSVWSGWFLTPGVSSFRRGGSVQGEARAVGKGPVGRWAQRGQ